MRDLNEILSNKYIWGHNIMFPMHTAWIKLPDCGTCSVIWSEIRKDEDDIQAGDILTLREWNGSQYTGRVANMLVKYVLRDVPQYGLMHG